MKTLNCNLDVETDLSRKPLFITELGINLEGMQFDPDVNKFQTHITDIMNRLILTVVTCLSLYRHLFKTFLFQKNISLFYILEFIAIQLFQQKASSVDLNIYSIKY